MVIPASKYMTPEEYLAFEAASDEKHEYSDGYIYDMAGASIAHNFVVTNLIRDIGSFLKNKECHVLPSDMRITIPKFTSYFYPDVTIFCGELEKQQDVFDTLTNPSVIIEVQSKSTRGVDKGMKLFKYMQIQSLKEYIIIETDVYSVQTVVRQDDQTFRMIYALGIDSELFIDTIQMHLPLKDIYYMVSLEK